MMFKTDPSGIHPLSPWGKAAMEASLLEASAAGSHPGPPSKGEGDGPLVRAEGLAMGFDVSPPLLNRILERKPRQLLQAVDEASFTIRKGETLALVGESGCGKSTVARMLVGLYQPSRGRFFF